MANFSLVRGTDRKTVKWARHFGTPQGDIMAKRTLEDLAEKASLVLGKDYLVEIAEQFSPTAAYEVAISRSATVQEARACRYLAMIRRDYGHAAMRWVVDRRAQSELQTYLEEEVVPKIKLLESIAEAPLLANLPQKKLIPLAEYLQMLPCLLDIELSLGQYNIKLGWAIDRETSESYACNFDQQFSVSCGSKELLSHHVGRFPGRYYSENDIPGLTKEMLSFVSETLIDWGDATIYKHGTIASAIVRHRQARKVKFATPLYQSGQIYDLVEKGKVLEIQNLAQEHRAQALEDGVKPNQIVYLDSEVQYWLLAANRRQKALDPGISLHQKLEEDLLDIMGGHRIVPGEEAKKTYSFFLYTEFGGDLWLETLAKLGYSGSLLIFSGNMPSGYAATENGEIDGLLIHDLLGNSSKVWWIEKVQQSIEAAGRERLPWFGWDDLLHGVDSGYNQGFEQALGDFLSENFPLE